MQQILSLVGRTSRKSVTEQQPLTQVQQQAQPQVQIPRSPMRLSVGSPLESGSLDFAGFADDDELLSRAAPSAAAAAQPEPSVHAGGPISVSTKVEYAALPRGRAQDVFSIVTLHASSDSCAAAATSGDTRQPLDLICVLDVSGSMQGEKLQQVQAAVRLIIQESMPQDRLSIITFHSVAARPLRLRRMDAHGKDEATATTLRLCANGGTDIYRGLEAAVEVAERRRQRNPVGSIFLLTDGQDGSSVQRYAPLLDRARNAGCSVYAFGFGSDHDSKLLSGLAELAVTPFTFVEDVGNIPAAFMGAMGGLASVIAQDVKVIINCRVPLKAVHTPFSMTRTGDSVVIRIPDMLAGERRDLLVELAVPADREGVAELCLLEASAQYLNLAAGAAAQTPAEELRLRRLSEDEPQPELEPDEEVVTQRQRVEVAQALQEAAMHGDAGRFDAAQQVLGANLSKLKAARHRTPVSHGLELEVEDAQSRMKNRSSWENGGGAEVRDAMNMHKMQRATNLCSSKATSNAKCSKAMYLSPNQAEWCKKG